MRKIALLLALILALPTQALASTTQWEQEDAGYELIPEEETTQPDTVVEEITQPDLGAEEDTIIPGSGAEEDTIIPGSSAEEEVTQPEVSEEDEEVTPQLEVSEELPEEPDYSITFEDIESSIPEDVLEILREDPETSKTLLILSDSKPIWLGIADYYLQLDDMWVAVYSNHFKAAIMKWIYNLQPSIISAEYNSELEVMCDAEVCTTEALQESQDVALGATWGVGGYLTTVEPTEQRIVAVLDTGISDNTSFEQQVIRGATNVSGVGDLDDISDSNGHGTSIAELISTFANSYVGILPVKIANNDGQATILSTYVGIQESVAAGVDVINLSMNTTAVSESKALQSAIDEATAKGVYIVVSAGNDGIDTKNVVPANVDSAIVVSAATRERELAEYSNYGETIDYCAYGDWNGASGTSFAAARISSIIATILTGADEPTKVMTNYAFDLGESGKDSKFGNGLITSCINIAVNSQTNFSKTHYFDGSKYVGLDELFGENLSTTLKTSSYTHKEYCNSTLTDLYYELYYDSGRVYKTDPDCQASTDAGYYYGRDWLYYVYGKHTNGTATYLGQITYTECYAGELPGGHNHQCGGLLNVNGEQVWWIYDEGKNDTSWTLSSLLTKASSKFSLVNLTCSASGPIYGHDVDCTAGSWTTTKAATCTKDGTKEKKCTVCKQVVDTGKITKLGHATPSDYSYATNNGITKGLKYKNCSRSGCNTRLTSLYRNRVYVRFQQSDGTWGDYDCKKDWYKESGTALSWSRDADATYKAKSWSATSEAKAQDFYVSVNRKQHTVTLSKGTGIASVSGAGTYYYNQSATINATLSTGYHWVNWTGSATYTNRSNSFSVKENKTFAANAAINTSTLYVDPNGGTWGGSTGKQNFTQNYNTTKSIANPTITNYTATFNGNSGTADSSSITTNKAFKDWSKSSTFTAGSLSGTTFTFGATNGGTGTLTASYSGSYKITLPSASKTGYKFNGWYTAASGGTKIGDAGAKVTLSSNVTYYAHWSPITYTVKYQSNGGYINDGTFDYMEVPADSQFSVTQEAVYDTAFTTKVESLYARPGYTFVKWNRKADSTGTDYGANVSASNLTTTADDTVPLYAIWSANPYTISFDANGGTGSLATISATYDVDVTLPVSTMSRTGYMFNGWNTAADGSGTVIADGATVNNLTTTKDATVTLYAQWKHIEHTVIYDYSTNGGIGSSVNTESVEEYAEIPLTVVAFKEVDTETDKENSDSWKFVGWSTEPDSTEVISDLTMGTEDVTLYAVFKKTIKVTYYDEANPAGTTVSQTIWNNETTANFARDISEKQGWYIVGWCTETAPNSEIYLNFDFSKNTSLYAKYGRNATTTFHNFREDTEVSCVQYVNTADFENIATEEVELPMLNKKANWEAAGWSTDGSLNVTHEEGAKITIQPGDEYYAVYNRAFEVQLDGRNSNTNQVFTLDSSYCVSGESAVATFDLLEEYETELVSKDFKTWNTLPYGSGTSYKTGQTINIVKDTTLYAQYEDKATSGITINKTAETIMKGDTLQLTAAITPADSKDTILWETSDSSIATVDKNGLVTGIENGTVVITAKSKKNPEVTVTVYVMVVAYTVRIPSTFMLNTPATISASVSSNKYKLDVSLESLSVLSDDNGNSYELVAEDASEEEYVALEEGDVLLSTTNKANMKLRFTTAIPAKLIKKGNYTAEVVFRVSRAKK